MSRMTMYKTDAKGNMTEVKEFKNSWLGAPFIWEKFGNRYCRPDDDRFWNFLLHRHEVFKLFTDDRLNDHEKAVLGSTFDRVMVKRERLHTLIFAFGEFQSRYSMTGNNNLNEQMKVMGDLQDDPDCFAICWDQTSIAQSSWIFYEGDDWRMYDITRDSGHWFLYDAIDEVRATSWRIHGYSCTVCGTETKLTEPVDLSNSQVAATLSRVCDECYKKRHEGE